jgi:hypothetical protein
MLRVIKPLKVASSPIFLMGLILGMFAIAPFWLVYVLIYVSGVLLVKQHYALSWDTRLSNQTKKRQWKKKKLLDYASNGYSFGIFVAAFIISLFLVVFAVAYCDGDHFHVSTWFTGIIRSTLTYFGGLLTRI